MLTLKVLKNNVISFKEMDVFDIIDAFKMREDKEQGRDKEFSHQHTLESFYKIYEEGKMWVAFHNNKIIAYSRVWETKSELNEQFAELQDKSIITLKGTFVDPEYRGIGLQKEMHKISDNYIKSKGYDISLASVHPDNKASISNLKKLGMKVYGIKMAANGTRRLIMIKDLK